MDFPSKNFKKSTADELKKLGRNALKSAGKDLTYLRTHNVKLLKPGNRKTAPVEAASESGLEREPAIPVTAGWYDGEPDSTAVVSFGENADVSVVENENQITLDSLDLASGDEYTESIEDDQLMHDIQRINDNPYLDEAEKADRILKVNVKYYISGLLDAVCGEGINSTTPK